MQYEFSKLNGLGNDFVFIEDLEDKYSFTAEQVAEICDRHFGIGGDGVIVVKPSPRQECAGYMHYINSDGSLAQMCGNGVRCFAKYLVDHKIVDPSAGSCVVDTLSGPKPIDFTVDDQDKMLLASVDMGMPILEPAVVPTTLPATAEYKGTPVAQQVNVESPWGSFAFTCVSMGNPHAVCIIDNWDEVSDDLFAQPDQKCLANLNIDLVGAYFERHEVFPEKTNVEFVAQDENGWSMRVFERGCGETLACGTGTCATNVALALTGHAGRENDIKLLGGILHIEWREDDHIIMTGPAADRFSGVIEVE